MTATSATQATICRLADDAVETDDPEAALRTLRELRAELEDLERGRAKEALEAGCSFGRVARALGISRQSAHRRYRDLAPAAATPRTPLSSHGRRVLELGRQEAAAAHVRMASEHILLGVIRSGGGAAQALEAEGVTADAARDCMRIGEGGSPTGDHGSAPAVLREAMAIAAARKAPVMGADHLALASLTDPEGGAVRTITALGVTVTAVRRRLGC